MLQDRGINDISFINIFAIQTNIWHVLAGAAY